MKDGYTATPRLLYVALQLFMKQGFNATSIDQICQTTGVSKGAFFHHFRSKNEIAEAVIENYWELLTDYLFGGLETYTVIGQLEQVRERFCGLPDHVHFENGSLLNVLAHEVTPKQTGTWEKLRATYIMWEDRLAGILVNAGFNPGHAQQLSRQWIAVYEGACAQAKIAKDKNVIKEQLVVFEALTERP